MGEQPVIVLRGDDIDAAIERAVTSYEPFRLRAVTEYEPFRLPAPHEIHRNGVPIHRDTLRAVQRAWLAGERRVWVPIRAHRRRMRHLHSAYPARWRR